ncbi:hypothetical protein [Glycomyces buryatensis]|uniref:Uncharacterized protein n=1 Tax=Glycomyces buryatensis TaxID=2570927 RepID=A0A4S8Q3D8_9ACTN|nr:hypothetical protein [Glycomyces buryatensis]THV37035.1 hypothetical protein FAB82_21005 [Glycomyces buryatensis]
MPAKSKHMERRKQRIANAKKNARLASKLRHRRQLQALFGLLAIAAVLTLGYLWQSGFFKDDPVEPPAEETPTAEVTEAPSEEVSEGASEEASDGASEPAEGSEAPSEDAETE